MINFNQTSYDDWKLDCPPEIPEDELFSCEVKAGSGIFCWQAFALKNQQCNVSDWAWDACRKGPFTSFFAKLVFWLNVAVAQCTNTDDPIALAAFRSIAYADESYFEACYEIEDTWRDEFSYWSLKAIQEQNYVINLYKCDFVEEG